VKDAVDELLAQWHCEHPELDVSPMGILGRISRASELIDRRIAAELARFDLLPGEFDLLATLRRSGHPFQLAVGDLTRSTMVTPAAITNRLDRLTSKGFVRRELDPTNRRSITVTLTAKGLKTVENALPAHVANEHAMVAHLTVRQQKQFADLLRQLLIPLEGPDT
jgi:DNA-binding MarR family transcriptional regulator